MSRNGPSMMSHRRRSLGQTVRVNWRDFRVLLRAFSRPLLLFVGTIGAVGLVYRELSLLAGVEHVPSAPEAIFTMLAMIFLQANIPFPDPWYLQIFFFLMPVIGVALLSAGAANLGVKLFKKSARGQDWEVALASTFSDHVLVCRLCTLGNCEVLHLLEFGQSVVAIEQDPAKPFISQVRELDVPVIIADARVRDALTKGGIERAAAIICCTQDDLTNLDIALDAREMNANIKIVLRMFDADLAQKIERGFGIHTAFSTSALAAPAFAAAATRANIEYSFYVGDTLLHVSQVTIDDRSPLANQQIEQVERDYDLTIVMHRTDETVRMHPHSDDVIHVGDMLVVFASLETLGRLGVTNHDRLSGAKIRQPQRGLLERLLKRT